MVWIQGLWLKLFDTVTTWLVVQLLSFPFLYLLYAHLKKMFFCFFISLTSDLGSVIGIMFIFMYVLMIFDGFLLQKPTMDAHGEMGLTGNQFDPSVVARLREDEYDQSRSGSDNAEGASGDDQESNQDRPPRKKKYHRHTAYQIQELESYANFYFYFSFSFEFYVFVFFLLSQASCAG